MPLAQRENCAVPNKELFGPMVRHISSSKTLMYIHVFVCVTVCMYVHTCVCMCSSMHVCTYMCLYVLQYVCMYIHVFVCVIVCMYVHTCVCMCSSMYSVVKLCMNDKCYCLTNFEVVCSLAYSKHTSQEFIETANQGILGCHGNDFT